MTIRSSTTRAALIAATILAAPVALSPMLASPAHAQFGFGRIVFDPSNYAQNVLTAARTLEQINHQITSLQNEAQMLINQARNLASLPYSSLQQLQQNVQRTQQLLGQAQNIAFEVGQIDQAFQQQYGNVSLSATEQQLVEGYEDADIAAVLAPTVTAFDAAYQGIAKVHEARAKASTNPTWNEAQQVIHTQDLADKVFASVAKGFDSVRANLEKGIAHLEGELSRPVESKAAGSIAAEVRAHLKGLPSGERMKVIQQAIYDGDHTVATAALGAPAMLSGMDPKMQAVLVRMYHERHSPATAKRLKAMQGAKEMIEQRAGIVHTQLEKAVGMAPHKVRALRNAKNAAEQAFILKDA